MSGAIAGADAESSLAGERNAFNVRIVPTFQVTKDVRLAWGAAILTREILASTHLTFDDDTDYLSGLLHNIGKVVMAYAFPEELALIAATPCATTLEVTELETLRATGAETSAYWRKR